MDVAGGFGPRGDVVQNVDELQGPSFAALPNDEIQSGDLDGL